MSEWREILALVGTVSFLTTASRIAEQAALSTWPDLLVRVAIAAIGIGGCVWYGQIRVKRVTKPILAGLKRLQRDFKAAGLNPRKVRGV